MNCANHSHRSARWILTRLKQMPSRWLTWPVGFIVLVCCLGAAADGPVFKSSSVRAARSALETALRAVRKDFDEKSHAAVRKYSDALDVAIRQATRDGDLDEANKLTQERQALDAAPYAAGIPILTGTWQMRWGARGVTPYTFAEDGRVSRVLANAPTDGVLRRTGDALLIDFGNQSVMRVNLSGQRLFLEYWETPADYPQRFPTQIGVGERVNP